ncbi:nitrate- and nitrite sensing domain-containing protein [Actinophytocola glycyrrhizae]|uniref:histidine kinase n=1 Tax=Actinophytocola glycyrrhizae TaxID=2044873 RepID=A0ABV9SDI6_9PSEU
MSTEPGNESPRRADESASQWSALMSVLANWRDWNLPVKLAAVTLVPVVFAIVLGTMQISDQVDKASSYRRVDRLVVVNEELRGLVGALQAERGAAGVLLADRAEDVPRKLVDEQFNTDNARAAFLRAAGRVTLDHEAAAARYADAERWLGELGDIREQVAKPGFDAANAVTRYSTVIDALLRFDRTMASEAIDPTLASTAAALYDLEEIKEEVSYQHAVIAVGLARGSLTGPEAEALTASVGRQADRLADFYSLAGENRADLYDTTVAGTGIAGRNNIVAAVLANPPGVPLPTDAQAWQEGSELTAKRIGDVAGVLGTDLRDRSAALQDEASDGAGLAAVILLVALVVAIGVMFVVGRHLLSSLAALRGGALDVAERALPDAVARIRDRGEHAGDIELPPVPVNSMDEVGQVARAFDAVQRQALRLATEQAGLRATYSSVFVNLSRRSQGLVQRQLQLLERLERDEEDSDQLATLFQLDHLATRMRRNNENLMVLSGSEGGRRSQRPANLADLLRASVSEIEQYQRVVLLPPPSVQVVGYAVGDLVRLVAELLDNATAFSAPDTQVTIASHSFEDGSVCIAVLDEGIGMNQVELDEANAKLADSGLIDVATSRRMGLFVIGRLAGRHGIEVRLNGGQDVKGVRATVTVPAEVIVSAEGPVEPQRAKAPANGTSLLAPFSLAGERTAANGTNGTKSTHVNGTNGHANGHANGRSNGHTNGVHGLKPSSLPRRDQPTPEELAPKETAPEETQPEETQPEETAPKETEPKETVRDDQSGDGRPPLPRRSPGGKMPGPRGAGTPRGDIASPRGPFEPPARQQSGAGLFSAAGKDAQDTSGWWTAGTPVDRSLIEETTPIFDEMVSAWFRAVSDPAVDDATAAAMMPQPPDKDEPRGGGDAWNFAADSGFDAARAASKTETSDFTSGGLPRRSPRQNLVPGSAAPRAAEELPRHGRDAEDVRSRLSEYRQGVRRARDHRGGVEPPSQHAAPVIPPRPSPPARPAGPTPDPAAADAETAQLDLSGAGWRFAADIGWRAANQASAATPVDFTSGGLPRRSPRQNLVPGSVSHSGRGNGTGNGAGPSRADRAEEMRGRLGSFQTGLSRGRRSLAERGSANGVDHKQQQESE